MHMRIKDGGTKTSADTYSKFAEIIYFHFQILVIAIRSICIIVCMRH